MPQSSLHRKIKVAQFGLGSIGKDCIRLLVEKSWIEVVGAIDIDPDLTGKEVAAACGLKVKGVSAGRIFSSFEAMCAETQPEVIIHTAGSQAATSLRQCRPMLEKGLTVISSCEELFYPWHRAKEEAEATDELCRRAGARLLGTGVNPGFIFDLLPICLSGVCRAVRGLDGKRIVNASTRREPFQKKIGSGLAPDAFEKLWREGKAGHAGFPESLLVVARAFGWKMGPIHEKLEAIVAEKEIRTPYFHVRPGQTRGMRQVVSAVSEEGHPIRLELQSALDAETPGDTIRLDSDPPLQLHISEGIAGDVATVAALVNVIPRLLATPPGLKIMTDLPLAVV